MAVSSTACVVRGYTVADVARRYRSADNAAHNEARRSFIAENYGGDEAAALSAWRAAEREGELAAEADNAAGLYAEGEE